MDDFDDIDGLLDFELGLGDEEGERSLARPHREMGRPLRAVITSQQPCEN
jgi:hypothetical protein